MRPKTAIIPWQDCPEWCQQSPPSVPLSKPWHSALMLLSFKIDSIYPASKSSDDLYSSRGILTLILLYLESFKRFNYHLTFSTSFFIFKCPITSIKSGNIYFVISILWLFLVDKFVQSLGEGEEDWGVSEVSRKIETYQQDSWWGTCKRFSWFWRAIIH